MPGRHEGEDPIEANPYPPTCLTLLPSPTYQKIAHAGRRKSEVSHDFLFHDDPPSNPRPPHYASSPHWLPASVVASTLDLLVSSGCRCAGRADGPAWAHVRCGAAGISEYSMRSLKSRTFTAGDAARRYNLLRCGSYAAARQSDPGQRRAVRHLEPGSAARVERVLWRAEHRLPGRLRGWAGARVRLAVPAYDAGAGGPGSRDAVAVGAFARVEGWRFVALKSSLPSLSDHDRCSSIRESLKTCRLT